MWLGGCRFALVGLRALSCVEARSTRLDTTVVWIEIRFTHTVPTESLWRETLCKNAVSAFLSVVQFLSKCFQIWCGDS
jgi:hypothetical protein